MEEPIIEMKNLTMSFGRVRRQYGLKSAILHFFNYVRDHAKVKWFNALDGVSISIAKGERVGIVGPNGSGKTTMLSVIGGVYRRYQGELHVRGRVSMMLALGAGFNNQLSGQENIMLNGILQGKTKKEMEGLLKDVVDFADIGEFIDAPLYQYSSGMKARLGFGVATAIKPDILLVDEVMAVGDADFKRRSEARIKGLLKEGTTLVLVSHSPGDIRKYCNRVIRLEHGKVVADGTPDEVLSDDQAVPGNGGAKP